MRLTRIQFGIPVKIIAPTFVQIIGREGAPDILQLERTRTEWTLAGEHPDLVGHAIALDQIAARTCRDDILPRCSPAFGPRDQMVEGQVVGRMRRATVLAHETIA